MSEQSLLESLSRLLAERDFKTKRALGRQIEADVAGDRDAVGSILLGGADDATKIALLEIVGSTERAEFDDAVRRTLESGAREEVLQTAATALGKLHSPIAFDILTALLRHKSPNVRLGAIYGLMAHGDSRAIAHLAEHLDDRDSARSWWPSPKAGGYRIGAEASAAIDSLSGTRLGGDRRRIQEWIDRHSR